MLLPDKLLLGNDTIKAKAFFNAYGGTLGWGFKAIAKKSEIWAKWIQYYSRGKYQGGLDNSFDDDDDDDDGGGHDLGNYDSDQTF